MTIPIGPQHPLLKEPLSFLIGVEGEEVLSSSLRLGYVHRGIEKLSESRTFLQNVHLFERICGICSHIHTTTYCQGVEDLLELEVPPRGLYIRVLLCEFERIHSHLLWLGVLAKNIGLDTIFMYAWRDREIVLQMMEEISGGRVSHAINLIGGVRKDISQAHIDSMLSNLPDLLDRVEELNQVLEHDRTFQTRTRGIGRLSLEEVKRYCVVGPVARASGLDMDIRRDQPYACYSDFSFDVPVMDEGDIWARTRIRLLEAVQSIGICRQILEKIPDGEIASTAARKVPAGEVLSRAEGPRGEVVYFIKSDGSQKPVRVKVRTPTMTALITLPLQLKGMQLADVSAIIAGVDLCIACADR
jgi:NADH-quinone oxidoreductase subunit D